MLAVPGAASPSGGSSGRSTTAVTIGVDLTVGEQSATLDGLPITDANGHARFGLGPVFESKLHFACRYAGPPVTTNAGYDLYDKPYTLALTLQSRKQMHSCTSNPSTTALTYVSVEGRGPVVQTNLGTIRVGERWPSVPAKLRKAAKLIEGGFLLPIEDPCHRNRSLLDSQDWRMSIGLAYPAGSTATDPAKSTISDIVVMAGGLKGVPLSGPAC